LENILTEVKKGLVIQFVKHPAENAHLREIPNNRDEVRQKRDREIF
jgi:hypothetical protein